MVLTHCLERRLVSAAANAGVERLVVGAVIQRNCRTLLLRRKHGDFMGGLYELPSGVVEPGEAIGEALRREVMEETGLRVAAVEAWLGFFNYVSRGGRTTRQFNFRVSVDDFPFISLSEHDAFIWARASDLERLRVSEAVRNVLRHPSRSSVIAENPPGETPGPAESQQSG